VLWLGEEYSHNLCKNRQLKKRDTRQKVINEGVLIE